MNTLNPILKLHFSSVWPKFDPNFMPQDYFFAYVLSKKYKVVFDDKNPDVVIYSLFGNPPKRSDYAPETLFVAYSGEPHDVSTDADIRFGFHDTPLPTYYRLPIWVLYLQWDTNFWSYELCNKPQIGQGSHHVYTESDDAVNDTTHPMRLSNILQKHLNIQTPQKFCNFTYTRSSKERVEFFLKLNTRLKVDSTGGLFNNTGVRLANKAKQLQNWKFTLAFENTMMPGYVTEKLLEPLAAGSIPIYKGGIQAKNDFNSKRFIFVDDFSSYEQCIDWILHVNQSSQLIEQYLHEPIFSVMPDWPTKIFDYIYYPLIHKNKKLQLT